MFELLPGGSFSPDSQTGSIELKSFSLVLVAIVMSATIGGAAAGLAAGVAASPLTAVAAIGVATLDTLTNGKFYNIDDVLNHICIVPSFYCHALFYKNPLHNKVMMSLAVVQDLPSSNKVLSTFINSYIHIILIISCSKCILLFIYLVM